MDLVEICSFFDFVRFYFHGSDGARTVLRPPNVFVWCVLGFYQTDFDIFSWGLRYDHLKSLRKHKIQPRRPVGSEAPKAGFCRNLLIFRFCPILFSWFRWCQNGFDTTKRVFLMCFRILSDRFWYFFVGAMLRPPEVTQMSQNPAQASRSLQHGIWSKFAHFSILSDFISMVPMVSEPFWDHQTCLSDVF